MSTDKTDRNELLDLLAQEDPQGSRTDWSNLLDGMRASDDDAVSDDVSDGASAPSGSFNATLRSKWEAEATSRRRPLASSRKWTFPRWALAAAAVLAIVLILPALLDRNGRDPNGAGSGVAWADVVQAMQRVQQFRMVVFSDDPRSADEKTRMFRIDLFFQHPDRWRAHGMGYVAFSVDGNRRTWSAEKRKFTEKGDRAPDMFPREFVEAHRKSGTLAAILGSVFDGQVPQGEPVRSDEVSAAQGIDVFDYATRASEKWARIWVLRESKLPLKMHLYHPGSDEFTLVTFDYSDPQPDPFFDPDAFAAEAAKLQGDDPYRAYSIGSRPVAGARPRAADQVHEVEGGYHAPKVRRVLSNAEGWVLVVTDNPRNMTPEGHPVSGQEYRHIADNWGNRYIRAGGGAGMGEGADQRWYFMPLPPAKLSGDGPRTLTMSFVIEPRHDERKVLTVESLSVPDPSVKGEKDDWKIDLEKQKRTWYRAYLREEAPLAEQLAEIERVESADPGDAENLAWKFRLLREHGREPAAWSLFESSLRDRVFADARLLDDHYTEAAQYLLHLAAKGRDEDLRRYAGAAAKIIADVRSSKDPRTRMGLNSLTRDEHNPLLGATRMLEWKEKYKDGPKVVRTLSSRDGMLFVEYAVPKPPEGWQSSGWDGSSPYGWFWQPFDASGRWHPQAKLVELEAGRLCIAYRWWGEPPVADQIKVQADVMLLADNYGHKPVRNDFKLKWERTLDVPEPSVEKMVDWWAKELGGKGTWFGGPEPTPETRRPASQPVTQKWIDEANAHRDAGRFAEALPLYQKVSATPAAEWPEHYTDGMNPTLLADVVRRLRVGEAQCLAELGRLDEARQVATTIREDAPVLADLTNRLQAETVADAVRAEVHVARALLNRGDPAAAAKELERIAVLRPMTSDLPHSAMETKPWGKSGWHPRSVQEAAWREFDATWWDVRDALSGAAETRPTTSAAAG